MGKTLAQQIIHFLLREVQHLGYGAQSVGYCDLGFLVQSSVDTIDEPDNRVG
jgi:hypothetical protein